MSKPSFDFWDFVSLMAGALCPPLFAVAGVQWWARRNKSATAFAATLAMKRKEVLESLFAKDSDTSDTNTNNDTSDLLSLLTSKEHLLIIGHTGGGKTVLMHALARLLGKGAVVTYCDPDAIRGRYPRYRVVGAGDDYRAIGRALELLEIEVEKRRQARADGQRSFNPLWVFIDEAHDVVANVDGALSTIEDVVRRGRKLNIHAAIGTQDSQVRTLGLEGKSKLLDNLTRVDVQLVQGRRCAIIGKSTHEIPELDVPDSTVVVPKDDAAALSKLLGIGEKVTVSTETGETVETALERVETVQEHSGNSDPSAILRRLKESGMSKKQTIACVFGCKSGGSPAYQRASEIYDEVCK